MDQSAQSSASQTRTQDVKTLISWQAPGRPFRKKGRQFYLSVLLIVFLIWVILFLFGEYLLMVTIGAFAFMAVVLGTIPPSDFHYKITTEGIKVEDHFYIWPELYDFYFKTMDGVEIAVVRTQAIIPGALHLPLEHISKEQLRRILIPYLPYREIVKPTFMEKSADWLAKNFPLERT